MVTFLSPTYKRTEVFEIYPTSHLAEFDRRSFYSVDEGSQVMLDLVGVPHFRGAFGIKPWTLPGKAGIAWATPLQDQANELKCLKQIFKQITRFSLYFDLLHDFFLFHRENKEKI